MRKVYYSFFIMLVFCSGVFGQSNWLIEIPETELKASEIHTEIKEDTLMVQASFQASHLVTLGEYKAFLTFLEKEYGVSKSNQYLPDSSITFSLEDYKKYLYDTIYEKDPVLGVSWENAMAYCIWKVREDNIAGNESFYRLPNVAEYAAIRSYDSINPQKELVRDDYSEWSIVSKEESFNYASFNKQISFFEFLNYMYFAELYDPPAFKRKLILGNNFHFKRKNLYFNEMYSMYQNRGYHFVGFRLVIEKAPDEADEYISESIYRLYDYQ